MQIFRPEKKTFFAIDAQTTFIRGDLLPPWPRMDAPSLAAVLRRPLSLSPPLQRDEGRFFAVTFQSIFDMEKLLFDSDQTEGETYKRKVNVCIEPHSYHTAVLHT